MIQHFTNMMIWLFKNPKIFIEIISGVVLLVTFTLGFLIGRYTKK